MAENSGIQYAGEPGSKVVFSGPPLSVKGTIPLTNTGNEKAKLRSIPVNSDSLAGVARLPLQQIAFGARLQPGQQARITSTIALDPHTPSGSYDFELNIGGQTVAATAHITDVVDFRIQPDQVTILSGEDSEHEREFVIENAGNVPLPLGQRCEAPLIDSIDLVTSMLVGLNKARADSEVKAKVKAWLDEWGERSGGMLVILRDPIILRPGQKITAKATFQLPADLKPFRHYQAGLQLYNAELSIDIYTTKKAGSNNQDPASQ